MRFIFVPGFPKIGRLVMLFVVSDLLLLSGWGLIQPIFAIFITTTIEGATLITVGVVASIYWLTKAASQLPIALLLDRKKGEKDDFIVLVFGLTLVGFSAFSFMLVHQIWQLYLAQLVHALGMAMYSPAWSGIFSRNLDKDHEALDWALDNSSLALAAGFTGLLGGYLATWFDFSAIFVLTGTLSLAAALMILITPKFVSFFGKSLAG